MVSDEWAYRNGADPAFYDESDIIQCDVCGESFDYKEYRSETCSDCENEGASK